MIVTANVFQKKYKFYVWISLDMCMCVCVGQIFFFMKNYQIFIKNIRNSKIKLITMITN